MKAVVIIGAGLLAGAFIAALVFAAQVVAKAWTVVGA